MTQENLITLKCEECGNKNYFTYKNKKKIQAKLEVKKFCKKCRKHTLHKEGKMKK